MRNFSPAQIGWNFTKDDRTLGGGKCKKTLEKLERQKANKLEVKRAETAHDKAFGDATRCMFILITN